MIFNFKVKTKNPHIFQYNFLLAFKCITIKSIYFEFTLNSFTVRRILISIQEETNGRGKKKRGSKYTKIKILKQKTCCQHGS